MSDFKFESRCKDCKNDPCNAGETLYCIFYNYKNFEQKEKETKTMAQRTITIDGDKLKKAIEKRGLLITHASKEMGRGMSYLSDCAGRGQISEASFITLSALYNIKREEIEPDKPIDISKNSEDAKDEFTLTDKDISDKLDRIIELLERLVNYL
jgi:hypothetical protein